MRVNEKRYMSRNAAHCFFWGERKRFPRKGVSTWKDAPLEWCAFYDLCTAADHSASAVWKDPPAAKAQTIITNVVFGYVMRAWKWNDIDSTASGLLAFNHSPLYSHLAARSWPRSSPPCLLYFGSSTCFKIELICGLHVTGQTVSCYLRKTCLVLGRCCQTMLYICWTKKPVPRSLLY